MHQLHRAGIIAMLLFACWSPGNAQHNPVSVYGTVTDSLTRLPVPFVAVRNQTSRLGTLTDEQGKFALPCSRGDTLLFTMVGYLPKKRVLAMLGTEIQIQLSENFQLLRQVVVYGKFQPQGAELWKKAIVLPGIFRNPAGPGSGYMVETFGPGVNITGLLSRFTKHEKEKRKLKRDRQETAATETYRDIITSEETKKFLMATFSLSEVEYSEKIEAFNTRHPEAAYLGNYDEIMKMLVNFLAIKDN